jgi:hypothetical protein
LKAAEEARKEEGARLKAAEEARKEEEARLKADEEARKEEEARLKGDEAMTLWAARLARTMTRKQLAQTQATAEERVQAMRARATTAKTEAQRAEEAWLKAVEEMEVAKAAMAPEEAGKETVKQAYEATMQAAEEARLRAGEAKKRAEEALEADFEEQSCLQATTQAEVMFAEGAFSCLVQGLWKAELGAKMQLAGGAGMASSKCKRPGNTNPGEEAEVRAAKRRHGGRDEGEGGGGGIGKGSGAGKR